MYSSLVGSSIPHRRPLVLGALLLALALPAAGQDAVDWNRLREAVVDLEVLRPGESAGTKSYGCYVEGIEGIVACHHMIVGADRVRVRPRGGTPFEVTSYVARDSGSNLIILKDRREARHLSRGTHLTFSHGQTSFVILPPSVAQPTYPARYANVLECGGMGEVIGLFADVPAGLPVTDSLGQVVGILVDLRHQGQKAICAIPVDRITALMAGPDTGGPLSAISGDRIAVWTRPLAAEGAQLMGAVLSRIRQFEAGLPMLERALDLNPELPEALLESGMANQNQGNFAAAESLYLKALAVRPVYAKAHLYLGSCYFMQGKYMQSEEQYLEAIDQQPEWPLAHVNLGGVYFLQQRQDLAEASFRQALVLEPQMGLAQYNLGMLYHSAGRSDEALECLRILRGWRSGFAAMLTVRTGLTLR